MGSKDTKAELNTEIEALRKKVGELERQSSLRAEQTSSPSERQFRNLAERSVQGFYIQDNFELLFANQAAARFFGYDSLDAFLRIDSVLDLLAPHERMRARELNARRRAQEEVPHNLEFEAVRKDGTSFWMEIVAQVVNWDGREAVQCTLIDITERKQAEAAQGKSEERSRAIADSVPALISYVDRDHRFQFLNKKSEEWFETDPGEFTGKHLRDALGDEAYGNILPYVEGVLAGETQHFEMRARFKQVGVRAVEIWYTPHCDKNNEAVGFYVAILDITERKQGEEELRANQKLLETVFNTIPHSLFVRDANSVFLMANRKLADRYGLKPEDLKGLHIMELPFATEAQREQFLKDDKEVLRTGQPTVNDGFPVLQADGKTKFFTNSIHPLLGDDEEIIGLVGIAEDITERKEAEIALRESEAKYRDLVETSHDMIWRSDEQGIFTYLNPAWGEVLGYPTEEMLGRKFTEFKAGASEARKFEFHKKILAGQLISAQESIHITKSGEERRLIFNAMPIYNSENQIIGAQGTARDITEQRLAELAMKDNETRLQNFIDSTPGYLSYVDRDLRYRQANARYLSYIGKSEEALIGHKVSEVMGEETFELYRPWIEQALEGREQYFEVSRLLGDQGMRNLEVRYIPNFDPQGKVLGFHSSVNDITELKVSQQELRESRDQIRVITDNLPVLITYIDAEMRFQFINKTAADWYGQSSGEVIGHFARDILEASAFDKFLPWFESALAGEKINIEETIKYPDGNERDVDVTLVPDFLENGKVRGFFGLGLDITERKQAETELRLHSEVAKNMVGGVLLFRVEDETITYTSPNFDGMFGYEPGELLEKKVFILNAPGEKTPEETSIKILARVQENGWWRGEIYNIKKDGTRFWSMAYISHFSHSRFGKVVLGVQHDITEQKQIEAQLRESQKMEAVGQLAGGIAHEFNNMLQIIIGGVHFARQNLYDAQLAKKDLDTILKSADRSAELTKQLLAFSRRTTLSPVTLNLNNLTTTLMKMLRPIIGEEISLDFKPGDDLFMVEADPGLLEQALFNLCVNARDAMPDGGSLIFETKNSHADQDFCDTHGFKHPGDCVMISVSDNGGGISPEIRERIFEPFFTTKEVGQGTGLGLSMVQGIIQQHDGAIEVLSEPGVGTTFKIYLPKADLPETIKSVSAAGQGPGGSETILVAEDEEEVLNMLRLALENMGYSVLAAKDGEEAMLTFMENRHRIDLVILDMVMPKKRGRVVYEEIRGSGSDVPILFSTGYPLDTSDAEYVSGSGLRTIQKPYPPTELYKVVRDLLDQR